MRDRLIAPATHKPPKIADDEIAIDPLSEGDFDRQMISEGNQVIMPECTVLSDASMQRELALVCIAQVKVCLCIGRIINLYFANDVAHVRDDFSADSTASSILLSENIQSKCEMFTDISLELEEWAPTLPSECEYTLLNELNTHPAKATLSIQKSILHMLHQTAVLVLHRPLALSPEMFGRMELPWGSGSTPQLEPEQAAVNIPNIAFQLHYFGLDRFIPAMSIILILLAAVTHLQDMRSPSSKMGGTATWAFRHCMAIFETLNDTFHSTTYLPVFLEALAQVGRHA